MKEQTKKEIYQYLQNYLNQKREHSDYVDYYEWFQLDESMTLKQIQKEIKKKKLEKLFHPDQQNYLDGEFQRVFKECSNEMKEMKNVFSNQDSKARYDQKLKNRKGQEKIDDSITLEDKKHVERAVETTTYKYGFYQGYMAFLMTLQDGFSMITNENNARDLLKQVGTRKIRKIIEKEEEDIMESNPNNMVMDYYSKVIDKTGLHEKAEAFYNACLQTALKYDLKNGAHQTEGAIFKYIATLNMDAFTNQNVDKLELAQLSPLDVQMLICIKMHQLGKENSNFLFSNFIQNNKVEQVKLFASEIQKEAIKVADQRKAM